LQKLGRYQLLRPIANGGMADVWLALHRPLFGEPMLVVIKRIRRQRLDDRRFIELFLQEGRLSTQLDHPNVVRTIEMGCADGQYFLALEYLRGQTVLTLLGRAAELRSFLPLGMILRIAADVTAGLSYAHDARDSWGRPLGLVHRDISPSNLFVTYDGVGKVLDFGIARAGTWEPGRAPVKGKLPYVSPEQARGLPVDRRSDLFALGVVLHEALTLRPLFRGKSDLETVQRVLEAPVPKPSSLRSACPPELDRLVLALLARDADDRPPDAASVLLQIQDITRKLGIPLAPDGVRDVMRASFAAEYHEDARLSAEEPPSETALATPAHATTVAVPATGSSDVTRPALMSPRRRGSRGPSSEVTPAPA